MIKNFSIINYSISNADNPYFGTEGFQTVDLSDLKDRIKMTNDGHNYVIMALNGLVISAMI